MTWQERLFAKATPDENGCWIWRSGSIGSSGYPVFGGPGGLTTSAHRWAHIAAIGPIPEGYEVDHLCNVPLSINPAHLEAVTKAENMRRRAERQTHCKRGHEFNEANTIRRGRGRACRTCFNWLRAGYRERDRAARPLARSTQERAA